MTTITDEQEAALADILHALMSNSYASHNVLRYKRESLHTLASMPSITTNEKVMRALLKMDPAVIASMPVESLTPELLRLSVELNSDGIRYIPEDLLTEELILIHAMREQHLAHVPKSKLTDPVLERILKAAPRCVCSADASMLSDRALDAFCSGLPKCDISITYEWLRESSMKALRYAATNMESNGTSDWFKWMVGIKPDYGASKISNALSANLKSPYSFIGIAMAECEAYTEAVAGALMREPDAVTDTKRKLFGPRLLSFGPLTECLETQHVI